MDFKYESYYDDGANIWMVPYGSLCLYHLDKKTRKLGLESKLPIENQEKHLSYRIVLYKRKIFLIPFCQDKRLLIYSLTTKQWDIREFLDIKIEDEIKNKAFFCGGILSKHYIYMFGYATSVILRFDIDTFQFEQISDIMQEHVLGLSNKEDGFFHTSYIQLEDIIYYPFMNTNAVLVFNLTTNKSEVYRIGEEGNRFISIAFDGLDFWMIPRAEGSIIRWNRETGEQCCYNDYPIGFQNQLYSVYRAIYWDGFVWIFRHLGNMNIKVNVSTGKIVQFYLPYDEDKISGCRYPIVNIENDRIRLDTGRYYEWIELDSTMNIVIKYNFQKSDSCILTEKKYYLQNRQREGIIREDSNCNLTDFLEAKLWDDGYKSQPHKADCGIKVKEYVQKYMII